MGVPAMKVQTSQVQLQAQRSASQSQTSTERLRISSGGGQPVAARLPALPRAPQPLGATPAPVVMERPRRSAPEASTRTAEVSGTPDERNAQLPPQLAALRELLERLTGRAIRVYGDADAPSAQAAAGQGRVRFAVADAATPAAPAASTPALGWVYEKTEIYQEAESTRFAASGVVRTSDGQEIQFALRLEMQRSFRVESSTVIRGGAAAVQQQDPLVINFDGTAAQLQEQRFAFDLDADGDTEQIAMLAGNRGYLALDRNANGRIDDGSELFGPASGQGFAELAQLDSDGNAWIDEADPAFAQLRVWMPQAEGGGSLKTLQEAGVGALYTPAARTPFELRDSQQQNLGTVRASSVYLKEDGSAGTVQHVDLSV